MPDSLAVSHFFRVTFDGGLQGQRVLHFQNISGLEERWETGSYTPGNDAAFAHNYLTKRKIEPVTLAHGVDETGFIEEWWAASSAFLSGFEALRRAPILMETGSLAGGTLYLNEPVPTRHTVWIDIPLFPLESTADSQFLRFILSSCLILGRKYSSLSATSTGILIEEVVIQPYDVKRDLIKLP